MMERLALKQVAAGAGLIYCALLYPAYTGLHHTPPTFHPPTGCFNGQTQQIFDKLITSCDNQTKYYVTEAARYKNHGPYAQLDNFVDQNRFDFIATSITGGAFGALLVTEAIASARRRPRPSTIGNLTIRRVPTITYGAGDLGPIPMMPLDESPQPYTLEHCKIEVTI